MMSDLSPLLDLDHRADAPTHLPVGKTDAGEDVFTNSKSGEAQISICVPTWKDSADALLCRLTRLAGADQCTLLLFDDGSVDADLTSQLARHVMRFPGPARLISAPKNIGRSNARNRLKVLAESKWVLFLDADMLPDDDRFLTNYLDVVQSQREPALIAGGFSLRNVRPTIETNLHAAQSSASECLDAKTRAEAPGRYVFTSNVLAHRSILDAIEFDPGFTGWGWEDVDWGLRVAADYPVLHIDNTATHLGLDPDEKLIEKYTGSAENFARLIERHPDAMSSTPLYRLARALGQVPGRPLLQSCALTLAKFRTAPVKARLFGLKLYRASVYGAHL
jgi:glycosyltransferase involved in cell wall biosynthesis